MYDVFVNQLKAAVDYVTPPEVIRKQQKMMRSAPQNKAIESAPSNKLTKEDFKGLSAKGVRAKARKAGVELKDKPFNTSAEKLVDTFLMRQ